MPVRASNIILIAAAVLTLILALVQVLKVFLGVKVYRTLGVDATLIQMAEAGSTTPTMIFAVAAMLLFIVASYAFSGAGVLRKLPMLRSSLLLIGLAYLIAAAFPWLGEDYSGTPPYLSTVFYTLAGLLHIIGTIMSWEDIKYRPKAW